MRTLQTPDISSPCRFDFERDAFAFVNELVCEYEFDAAAGRPKMVTRQPRPNFALRCFPVVRAARQFFYHAEFLPEGSPLEEAQTRQRIREIISRNPRVPCEQGRRVVLPGYEGLRAFSRAWDPLLKAECGGAWRSYVLRSHWRMVFPISRRHQERTGEALVDQLARGIPPIVHLVRFPQLTINHAMLVFGVEPGRDESRFLAYDPNVTEEPAVLTYHGAERQFTLPANRYWAGGRLDVIEVYRSWWF